MSLSDAHAPTFHDAEAAAQHQMMEELDAPVVRMHLGDREDDADADDQTTQTNGVEAAAHAPAAASHSHSAAAASASATAAVSAAAAAASNAPSNPHAGAVAEALLPLLQRAQPDVFLSAAPSLVEVLTHIQALPYESKATLFTMATTTAPAPAAGAAGPSAGTLIFRSLLDYFLIDAASGSVHDPVCKFLYDSYWQAATKLGHSAAAAAGTSDALPPAHLFLLNFLPFLIWKFLSKHYNVATAHARPATATSASSSAPSSSSPYAGLFTVFLALYNTERVLAARSGDGGILARPALPDLPALRGLVPFDAQIGPGASVANPAAKARAASVAPLSLQLPAISEATTPHLSTLLHVLLLKTTRSLSALLPEAREALVYLAGLATNSGLLSGSDLFAPTLRKGGLGDDAAAHASSTLPMRWNTNWLASSSVVTVRYVLSAEILSDLVVALTFALRQDPHLSGPPAEAALWRELAMLALRQVHCRAVEEMMPLILLQTTCLLQQEAELTRPPAALIPQSPSPSPDA